ncbi:hypothetical protein ABW21_db0202963 [Orbilia brochopaga]|nr:hypothetical protein ABW21_db0202963 [Drechslerella brochopaga]
MESIEIFLDRHLTLLEKARQAELQLSDDAVARVDPKLLSARGLACLNLTVSRLYTGLGGKTIVELVPDSALNTTARIPVHTLRTGDIVRIEEQPSGSAKKQAKQELRDRGLAGVVLRTTQSKIAVALNIDKQVNLDFPKRMWL